MFMYVITHMWRSAGFPPLVRVFFRWQFRRHFSQSVVLGPCVIFLLIGGWGWGISDLYVTSTGLGLKGALFSRGYFFIFICTNSMETPNSTFSRRESSSPFNVPRYSRILVRDTKYRVTSPFTRAALLFPLIATSFGAIWRYRRTLAVAFCVSVSCFTRLCAFAGANRNSSARIAIKCGCGYLPIRPYDATQCVYLNSPELPRLRIAPPCAFPHRFRRYRIISPALLLGACGNPDATRYLSRRRTCNGRIHTPKSYVFSETRMAFAIADGFALPLRGRCGVIAMPTLAKK